MKNKSIQDMYSEFFKEHNPQFFALMTDNVLVLVNDFSFYIQLGNFIGTKLTKKDKFDCLEYLKVNDISTELSSFWKNALHFQNKALDCLVFGTNPKAILETLPLVLKAHDKIYKRYPTLCPAFISEIYANNKNLYLDKQVFGGKDKDKLILKTIKDNMLPTSLERSHK